MQCGRAPGGQRAIHRLYNRDLPVRRAEIAGGDDRFGAVLKACTHSARTFAHNGDGGGCAERERDGLHCRRARRRHSDDVAVLIAEEDGAVCLQSPVGQHFLQRYGRRARLNFMGEISREKIDFLRSARDSVVPRLRSIQS